MQVLFNHLDFIPPQDDPVAGATGEFQVVDGVLTSQNLTVLHNRSVAEDVRFALDGIPYDGTIELADGKLVGELEIRGRSLLHSVPLTVEAFKRSFLGRYGEYAVTVGLVLFAFSTAIAWSYYGDRAMTYLFGVRSVMPFRIVYVIAFFIASFADTSLIWLISAITLALMALPNLLGIMLLRREVKQAVKDYWANLPARRR